MNEQIDDAVNERYRKMAEGKEPKPVQKDILWITPRKLGLLFGVSLVMSLIILG
jgi:cytochrome c-type biogenesis protein CcmH/NrfF